MEPSSCGYLLQYHGAVYIFFTLQATAKSLQAGLGRELSCFCSLFKEEGAELDVALAAGSSLQGYERPVGFFLGNACLLAPWLIRKQLTTLLLPY